MSTGALEDTDILLLLDFEEEHPPPCEGDEHHLGTWGHVPDQGASFFVDCPCNCYPPLMKCAGYVHYLTNKSRGLICDRCDTEYRVEELSIVPLDLSGFSA